MDFRSRRQLVIIAIAALILGGIGFFVFKANLPEPSCNDNRRNQGEEEIDCGGPCVPCALRRQKDLEIFWARFAKVRENTYDVAAEIRNPNVKLAASAITYEFKLFDTAGAAVAARQGKTFIYPGEIMHLAEIGLISGRSIAKVALSIRDAEWILAETIGPDLIAGSKEYAVEEEGGGRRSAVKAIIANRTIRDIPDIAVGVLVFDDQGNLLGVHRTAIEEIQAGQSRPVKFIWPDVFPKAISSILIEARSPADLGQKSP